MYIITWMRRNNWPVLDPAYYLINNNIVEYHFHLKLSNFPFLCVLLLWAAEGYEALTYGLSE